MGRVPVLPASQLGRSLVAKPTEAAYQAALKNPITYADHYLVGDGSTDDSAAFAAMLLTATANGTKSALIQFGAKTYRLNSQIILPYNGTTRQMPTIIFQGVGCGVPGGAPWGNAYAQTAGIPGPTPGSTVLDLPYDAPASDATRAKIHCYGHGAFFVRDLCLRDSSIGPLASTQTNGTAFVYVSNTAYSDHNVYYCGSHRRTGVGEANTPIMTGVIYGGTSTSNPQTLNANAPFQGYFSTSKNCFFTRVKRLRHFMTYANGIKVSDEVCDTSCKGTEVYRFDGGDDNCVGNIIDGGVYECVNFTSFVRANKASANAFMHNGLYDCGSFEAHYIFEAGATRNLVYASVGDDGHTWMTEVEYGSNTFISARQAVPSQISSPMRFIDTGSPTAIISRRLAGGTAVVGSVTHEAIDTTNNVTTLFTDVYTRAHATGFEFFRKITSTDAKNLFYCWRPSDERIDFITDRLDMRFQSGGEIRFIPGTGGTFWMGNEAWVTAGNANVRGIRLQNSSFSGDIRVGSEFKNATPTGASVGSLKIYNLDGTVWGYIDVKALT